MMASHDDVTSDRSISCQNDLSHEFKALLSLNFFFCVLFNFLMNYVFLIHRCEFGFMSNAEIT